VRATGLVDTHCHIAHVGEPSEVVAQAVEAGVELIIDIGMGIDESASAAARASELAPNVYASVGIHPNDLASFEASPLETMAAIGELATRPRVVGVGETGLDYYRDRSAPELQEEAFRAHIEIARQAGRALVVHCRDAHEKVLEVLDAAGPPERVVMHCFSGDVPFARACAERGYYCSFAGNLTYPRSDELRKAARSLPRELLLIETDAPFLAPQSHRGKPNHPSLIAETAKTLAEARSMPLRPLIELVGGNALRAFSIA
jgi:TatD DNase family protein